MIRLLNTIVVNNEDIKKFMKTTGKDIKTAVKDVIKKRDPKLGDLVEKTDRVIQSANNALTAISKPVSTVTPIDAISFADHLSVKRKLYTHHGLYIGERRVLHYAEGTIKIVNLEEFLGDSEWFVIDSHASYDGMTIVKRGLSRLGENQYDLLFNNCEHFVNWCRSGSSTSTNI